MRITFVQYGDYADAYRRLATTGEETYAGQRYSVDRVGRLVEEAEDVCVICVRADPHEEILDNGVRAIGLRLYEEAREGDLIECVARQRPSHLVVRSPIQSLLRWALEREVRTLPAFATSFPRSRLRHRLRRRRLVSLLSSRAIQWVGNHSVNSSRDLARIGVAPEKIVPWDWPPTVRPADRPAKDAPREGPLRLFYAGRVQETKGVGDALRALRRLRREEREVTLTVAGAGDTERYANYARELGVGEAVSFLGLIPYREIIPSMHAHDVVVVPSRHAYPEGLPLTIYDAYCSRSPLVASDHPMFRGNVLDRTSALVFRAGDEGQLARCVAELADDPALYRKLSEAAEPAWERLQIPVKWGDLLMGWIRDRDEDRRWLSTHSLASGRYHGQGAEG